MSYDLAGNLITDTYTGSGAREYMLYQCLCLPADREA
jgi:hypothetical protein